MPPDHDCVGDCLAQWAKRARGMHIPTWIEHAQSTVEALQVYRQRQAKAIELIEGAQYALLDHDLDTVRANLGALKGLL